MVKVTDMERHVTNCAAPEGGIELMAAIAGMMWRNYKSKAVVCRTALHHHLRAGDGRMGGQAAEARSDAVGGSGGCAGMEAVRHAAEADAFCAAASQDAGCLPEALSAGVGALQEQQPEGGTSAFPWGVRGVA